MTHFIKLTSMVINKLHIAQIIQYQGMYHINMTGKNIDGFILFSCGSVSTNFDILKIYEENNKKDYDIITEFIKNL